jgi:hypothetical protein
MKSDFELIQPIGDAAAGKTGDELTFTFPEVLEVIRLCTVNEIAVLGVEIFQVRSDGYYTKNLSVYDQQMKKGPDQRQEWGDYVRENNALAEEFIRLNPTGDDHVYVLTTSSWREFCEIQKIKRQ